MPIIGTVDPTVEVLYGDAKIILRGLSAQDVGVLLEKHQKALARIFESGRKVAEDESLSPEETDEKIHGLIADSLKNAPGLIADAIALAADEPDAAEDIMKWPAVLQLRCVQEIVALTFVSFADVGKLMGALAEVAPAEALPETQQ